MRAAVTGAFGEPLVVEDLTLDTPGPGEVRVRISAVAVCHSDIHAADGVWGGPLPAVYGHEASGTVTEVGEHTSSVGVGDRVVVTLIRTCGECAYCCRDESYLCSGEFALSKQTRLHRRDGTAVAQGIGVGAFAEEVVVHMSQVVPVPGDLPPEPAALLACGVITGFGAVVNTAQVEPGSSVVIIGAGGVGLNAIQGARIRGANPIVAVDVAAPKLDAAKRFGATHGVDASSDAVAHVRGIVGGRGADHVLVTVGSTAAIEQGLTFLRPGGTVTVVGMTESGTYARIDASMFAFSSLNVLGSRMGATVIGRDIPMLVDRYRSGELLLDELITGRYRIEDINDAIGSVRQGEALRNLIVFATEAS